MSGQIASNSIGVSELLDETYACLKAMSGAARKTERITSEIADDSDLYRIRTGYMGYDEYCLLNLKNGLWIISRGSKCGAYPGDEYVGDIIALLYAEEKPDHAAIKASIENGTYFRNSIIIGMKNQQLTTKKNVHEKALEGLLQKFFENNIFSDTDAKIGTQPVNPASVYNATIQYRKGSGQALAKIIITALEKEKSIHQ